jgi:hypothetical protein
MENAEKIIRLLNDEKSIFSNIEWNLGALIGMASVVLSPKLVNISNAPLRISADGLDVDGFQCLGVALLEKDRKPRADELLGMAKRTLMCESLEIAADFLARAVRIAENGKDPYEDDDYFSVDIRELWNPKKGRASSLIDPSDRVFLEKCAAPLRNIIRHNNGRLLPKKEIIYSGTLRDKKIEINYKWEEGKDNSLKMPLNIAHDIFYLIWALADDGLQKALKISKKNV